MAAAAETMAQKTVIDMVKEVSDVTLVEKLTAELKALQTELQSAEAKFDTENLKLTKDIAHWQSIQKDLVPKENLWWMDDIGTHEMVYGEINKATADLEANQQKRMKQLEEIKRRIISVTHQLSVCTGNASGAAAAVTIPDLTTKLAALSLDRLKTAAPSLEVSHKNTEGHNVTLATAYNNSVASAVGALAAVTVPSLTTTLSTLSLESNKEPPASSLNV